jgi:hypothetical protein
LIKPLPIGSDSKSNATMGVVVVADRAAFTAGALTATITSTLRSTNSIAKWGNARGIAAGRPNYQFDIIRLSVSYRLQSIPERSDARRQG